MRAHTFYAALVEGKNQGPILMETEMEHASEEAALTSMKKHGWAIRHCVVCCQFVGGNQLLFDDMVAGAERHQNRRDEDGEPSIPF